MLIYLEGYQSSFLSKFFILFIFFCGHFKADANEVLATTKELNQHLNGSAKQEELKEDLLRKLSFQAFGNLAPMNAFIGGLAAQEAMKVVCAFCEHFSFGFLNFLLALLTVLLSSGTFREVHAGYAVVVL